MSRIPPLDDVDGHLIYSPHDFILDRCELLLEGFALHLL